MELDVVVRGADQAERLVGRLTRRLENGRPQLLGLVDQLMAAERERFAGRGARWRRLSRPTIAEHRREGRGSEPLILTGELMRSLTVRGHPQQRLEVHPTFMRFGTRVYYARFHQKGEGVPKRTVVGLTRVQKASLTDELRDLLLRDL